MNREQLELEIYKKEQIIQYLEEEKERISDYIGLFEVAQAIDNVNKNTNVPIVKDRLGFIYEER